MGMAASQARFLGLTARKNNVEFEGQQVNQQRTTLSNQSANYYNDLLGMAVPIPPSVDDYTKTVYTFEDGALTNQITAMIAQPNGDYKVSYLRQWVDDFSVVGATTSIVNTSDKAEGPYFVGAQELRVLGSMITEQIDPGSFIDYDGDGAFSEGEDIYYKYKDANGTTKNLYYNKATDTWLEENPDYNENDANSAQFIKSSLRPALPDEYIKSLSEDQLANLLKEEEAYLQMLIAKYGEGDYMVRYVKNTSTEEWNPYFYRKSDLQTAIYDENGNSQSNINCYKIGSETKSEEVKAVPDCKIEKDSSGRYINLTMPQHDSEGNKVDGTDVTYALTTSTVTDQAKYEDAMNQYEFEKYQYDQAIQEINAKIEIIQAEDKDLELRLKQLDTEQRALSTELEAVGQVIQKNTESSFKTFG